MYCQEEVWRAITLYSTFIGSGAAIALLETLNARFAKNKQGIDAFKYMVERYDNKESFAKQQDLIAKLMPEPLAQLVGTFSSPEHASDGLYTMFAQVWCRIDENDINAPYDFCRRVLNAMRRGGTEEVRLLAYTHITQLDGLIEGGFDRTAKANASISTLPKMYKSADVFINTITRSWPTSTNKVCVLPTRPLLPRR